MSADEVKAAFPQLTLHLAKREQIWRHLERNEFGKAAALKEEIDGPLPRGRVVRLRPK